MSNICKTVSLRTRKIKDGSMLSITLFLLYHNCKFLMVNTVVI